MIDVTFNGQSISNDDKPGYFMVIGYATNPDAFNTIVIWASCKSDARMQLTNKHQGRSFSAIFVTRQTEY